MRLYVTAFAVAIVSTPVLVASTPINHPWHDIVTPQSLSSRSETPAGQDLPVDSSENEFFWGDYIHTGSEYYLPDLNKGKTTDVEVYHQPVPPKPIGQNGKPPTVPLPDDQAHDSTLYLTTHQDKSGIDMNDDKHSSRLTTATSASTLGSSPVSLKAVDAIHHALDAKSQQKRLATNDVQANSIPGHTNHSTVPPKRPKVGKSSKGASISGLIAFYTSKVKGKLDALAHEGPDSINIAKYIVATKNPPYSHTDHQEPSNIICFVFWSVRDKKFSSHCSPIVNKEPHSVSEYTQYLVKEQPVLIMHRVWSFQDIPECINQLDKRIIGLNTHFKSENQVGLDTLTDLFRRAYAPKLQGLKSYALAPSHQGSTKLEFEQDLAAKLNEKYYVDPNHIIKNNYDELKYRQSAEP